MNISPVEIVITDTDTLKMEYLPLPVMDMKHRFLYRFLEPVETVWIPAAISLSIADGKEGSLKKFALKTFKAMVKESGPSEDLLHPRIQKLLQTSKCEVIECQIVRKTNETI